MQSQEARGDMFSTPRKRARPRFSLLTCLEHGELYFGSHAASLHPTADQAEALSLPPRVSALAGRLMVASKSLTFEPDDPDAPLVRMVLKDVPRPLIEWAASTHEVIGAGAGAGGFEIHVRMLAARMERYQPLRTIKLAPTVPALRFSLQHTRPISFVNLLNSILDLSMKPHDSAAQARLQQLHAESEQVSAVTFDQTALVDPLEAQLMQLRVQRVRPMLTLPGLLLLTESRLYIAEPACIECPLTHWPLAALERVVCRRYLLRDVALELHFRRGSGADGGRSDTSASSRLNPNDPETLLVALPSRTARDQLLETVQRTAWAVLGRSLPPPPEASLREQTERWRHGLIDNFTYLLFLNDCAGRSLGDLAQYPVFPWVLADVTSTSLNLNAPATFRDLRKPVGALNEKRLAIFRERYDSMEPGQRFLYGTHYSAPAFVSYFLLRLAPELTLHLHGGSFDTADREFTSISEAWHSVLSSSSDVKELIPHFYHPPSASFLLNGRHLDLGVRSDGTPVGDVLLPPWASDATDFVTKCRAALESELCSSQLHRWIDLIFGYSQRGIAADEAHNLFCPQTYEADYSNLPAMDRRALESQVAEFGQTPLQLFIEPHPPRLAGASQAPLVAESELLAGLRAAAHEQARSVGYGDAAGGAAALPPSMGMLGASASGAWDVAEAGGASSGPSSGAGRGRAAERVRNGGPSAATMGAARVLEALSRLEEVGREKGLHAEGVSALCHAEDGTTLCVASASIFKVYCRTRAKLLRSARVAELQTSSCVQLAGLDLVCLGSWDQRLHLYSVGRGKVVESRYAPMAHGFRGPNPSASECL